MGPLLWISRAGLLGILVAHIYFTMLLWKENYEARPLKYRAQDANGTTVFTRTMRLSGLIVFAFIIFHLAHFTLGVVDPAYKHMETTLPGVDHPVHDVYRMVVTGFSNVPVVVIYIVGLTLLTMHLSHGIGSLFQTLGITNRRIRPLLETITRSYAWLLYIGYISIPISILVFGLGKGIVK
jgi:succinate dehydrogenase / fumarate reductase cytochrome b subunit